MFTSSKLACPFCVGQTNNSRKTLYVYPDTQTYFCHRCSAYGNLASLEDVEITLERKSSVKLPTQWNNKGERFSSCKPSHYSQGNDFFAIKHPNGKIVGVHERKPAKVSKTTGRRFLGYSENFLDLDKTYRIVEGPYDCIYPQDVCVFGIPSKEQAKLLKPYKLILCPDGDIWKSKKSVLQWLQPFLWNKIVCVERLPNNKDPDDVSETERQKIEWKELKNWIYQNC